MSHDWQTQKAEPFATFKQGARGVKVPKEAVVVFFFLAEEVKPQWAAAETPPLPWTSAVRALLSCRSPQSPLNCRTASITANAPYMLG